MSFLKFLLKSLLIILMIPFLYVMVALICSTITVNNFQPKNNQTKIIYLHTNGVHLDLILPVENLSENLRYGLKPTAETRYFSFGWGEENFYLNTTHWADLTAENAWRALFTKSNTLLHLTHYAEKRSDWVGIPVSEKQLQDLNVYLLKSFRLNKSGEKQILFGKGYHQNDNFYRANGNYTLFYTCNSWVNQALKSSSLKASLWTPFDFVLIGKYSN